MTICSGGCSEQMIADEDIEDDTVPHSIVDGEEEEEEEEPVAEDEDEEEEEEPKLKYVRLGGLSSEKFWKKMTREWSCGYLEDRFCTLLDP